MTLPGGTTTTTSTTTTSTTTTTLPDPDRCHVSIGLPEATSFAALQLSLDYASRDGGFLGSGGEVQCATSVTGLASFHDDDVGKRLAAAFVHSSGIRGPRRLARCNFRDLDLTSDPTPSDFQLTVIEASDVFLEPMDPLPAVAVGVACGAAMLTTTTSTLPPLLCGHPVDTITVLPTASDALYVLRTAVGLQACDGCVCDVDMSGNVTVVDSLRVLRVSVAFEQTLDCPPC